jgi:hypothetical protein
MDAYHRFVKRLAESFSSTDLDYAFTGALAVSYYGVPRTTSDVDILVSLAGEAAAKEKVENALHEAGLVFEERKIDEALVSGYNIASFKDKASPYTLDVIFSAEPLDKQAGKLAGVDTFFQKPEGLVLAKLRMVKATLPRERAAKDKEDVKAVLAFTKVDVEAVRRQAKLDGTSTILEDLMAAG